MFLFVWLRQQIAAAIRDGISDALETEPVLRSAPGPPALESAAETGALAIASVPEPVKTGKTKAR